MKLVGYVPDEAVDEPAAVSVDLQNFIASYAEAYSRSHCVEMLFDFALPRKIVGLAVEDFVAADSFHCTSRN